MDVGNDDVDKYSRQLRAIFDSCDLENKGYINRNEVIDLSQKLHLGDQVPDLLRDTFGDEFTDGQVSFEQFRKSFIHVLERNLEGTGNEVVEDEQSELSDYNYGDQYVPSGYILEDETCHKHGDFYHHIDKTNPYIPAQEGNNNSRVYIGSLRLPSTDEETLNGNGVVDSAFHLKYCTSARDSDICGKAIQVRRIWDEVAVGQSGCINLLQLSSVCEHIGMEKMGAEELQKLFSELDQDGDGLVSLEEFLSGLFGVETPSSPDRNSEDGKECFAGMTDRCDKSTSVSPPRKYKISEEKYAASLHKSDIMSTLDINGSGKVSLEDVKKHFHNIKIDADIITKNLNADGDGKVLLKDITAHLEGLVLGQNNSLPKTVLQIYKAEISMLHGRLESVNSELGVLRGNVTKLENEKTAIINESEEQLRKDQISYEHRLKYQEKSHGQKIASSEREWVKEREELLEHYEVEKERLEEHIDQLKMDLVKTRDELEDATTEIERMESDMEQLISQSNAEKKRYARLNKEIENATKLKAKIAELEMQLNEFSDKSFEDDKRIKELEATMKDLRDQNDEFVAQLEMKSSCQSSHKSSPLSTYFKDDVLRPLECNEALDANQIEDEKSAIIKEQEATIAALRRDLETVNRLLDENTVTSNERHLREVDFLAGRYETEISELQNAMETERARLHESHVDEKGELVENYEAKICQLRENLLSSKKNRYKEEEAVKWDNRLDLQMISKKLEEKVAILETEKAEMELNFLNEKAEIEQKFRIERAELEQNACISKREADRSREYVTFLKEDLSKKHVEFIEEMQRINRKDKEEREERMESQLKEKAMKYQKELMETRKSFNNQITEMENTFAKERASLREGFTREKTEIEQKYLRERGEMEDYWKTEYEHEMSVRLANLRKMSVDERAEVEENLRQEKYELSINLQHQKANAERNLRHMKTEMEIAFTEEKNQLLKDFEYEKNLMQSRYKREIADVHRSISSGELDMKGKMKDEFTRIIDTRRKEWESSFEKEKADLLESFCREKGELETRWLEEKNRMEENFDGERSRWEGIFEKEKVALMEKFQKQKQNLEEEFAEENRKIKENRDAEIAAKIEHETGVLKKNANHLEKELASLKQQKKELETKNQILELKHLSQKQEATEINKFLNEKKELNSKLQALEEEVAALRSEKAKLQRELQDLASEKATILDNSVLEITQQQDRIARLCDDKEEMQRKIDGLSPFEKECAGLKRENARLLKDKAEMQEVIGSLSELKEVNNRLRDEIEKLEDRERELQSTIHQKSLKITQLEEEEEHLRKKVETLEAVHKKEMDAQKERMNMQSAASATERSRYLRELDELRSQLERASASSERDGALKEKVFNDAKAEVMTLNKKLEEKSCKNRSLEESVETLEGKLSESQKQCQQMEEKVRSLKTMLNDTKTTSRDERNNMLTKSIRSDTLCTDLYMENAELMKQIANAEGNLSKAEAQVKQLADQKKALQRVISKICHASGFSSDESRSPP